MNPEPWIMTQSGRHFPLLDPRPGDVSVEDVAHALSHVCRFAGHTRRFYSVAEHSILVAEQLLIRKVLARPGARRDCSRVALLGLLHDGAEAYVGDVTRPLKRVLEGYRAIEDRIQAAIEEALLPPPMRPPTTEERELVKLYDMRALATERLHVAPMPAEVAADERAEPFSLYSPRLETPNPNNVSFRFQALYHQLRKAVLEP